MEQVLFKNRSNDAIVLLFIQLCSPVDQLSDISSHSQLLQQCTRFIGIRCGVWFCASDTVTILWVLRLVLRIKYSYNFLSVAFGFAHQIQLQFYECRVWFCASNTVTAAHLQHRDQLQWTSHKLQRFYYAPPINDINL